MRAGLIAAFWASTAACGAAWAQQAANPPPPAEQERPARRWPREVIILQGAADAAEFWKKLEAPDLIVSRPAPGRVGVPAQAAGAADSAIIDAVHVRGAVDGENVRVELDVVCNVTDAGPVWVPLGVDVPVLASAREKDRELEVRRVAGDSWEASLEGAGEHRLRIRATVPIRVGGGRRTLELAIPEAPATSFDLVLPRRSYDVALGAGEADVPTETVQGGEGIRVAAHVPPRSPLVVNWSEQEAGGARSAPLLSAQVEMAVDVDGDGVAIRSSWAIACVRGVARRLQIRLDDDEVVSRVQLNDQFPASGIERAGGGSLLTIPLAEPMRPGESRRLVLETRRASSGSKVLGFSGYPLMDAGEQSGYLGATHGQNLFVNVLKSQGLRRIDPRDLPTALKAKPGTTIALQFLEQPFALSLGVEEAPPLYQADVSAQIHLDPDGVRNETTMAVRWVRGSLFEIEVATPPDLKVVSIGPPELVEAATPPRPDPEGGPGRVLKIRLTPQARDRRPFSLKLSGRQPSPAPGDVKLGLFAPRGAVATTSTYALFAGRDANLEPLDDSLVREGPAEPAAPRAEGASPSLRLGSGRNPSTLDVRLERRTLEVRRETRLAARVSRRVVEVRQETSLRVRHGALSSLDIVVPAGVMSRWEASDGQRPIRAEDLEEIPHGGRRSRLLLDRPIVDSATLTFHYRIAPPRPLVGSNAAPLLIPWIAVESGAPGPCAVELSSDPDVDVAADDPAWTRSDPSPSEVRSGPSFRLEHDDARDGLKVSARLAEAVPLPPTVASRALIRSTLEADGGLRVRAWYAVESHPASLAVALPAGSVWLRARVDGRAVDRIDAGADGRAARIELPPESASRPVFVDLEYRAPAASAGRPWAPPALIDGAEVLQTYWLAEVPSRLAAVGVPTGWTDENRWAWDFFGWWRRPVAGAGRLVAWTAGPAAQPGMLDDAPEGDDSVRGSLYSRPGPPIPLDPWIVSKAWAVLVCSGLAMLAAVGLSLTPGLGAWIMGAVAAAVALSVALLPSDALGLAFQSSAFGAVLGALVHAARSRAMGRATAHASLRGSSGSQVIVPESSQRSSPGVGSDDSTAIRVRTSSTTDYLSPLPARGAEPDASVGARHGLGTG